MKKFLVSLILFLSLYNISYSAEIVKLPKDTASDPKVTFDQVKNFQEIGVKIIIGLVFNDNLI